MASKSSRAFRQWRLRLNLTQAEAAKVLGLGRNTVVTYDCGMRWDNKGISPSNSVVPYVVLLACSAVEAHLKPVE